MSVGLCKDGSYILNVKLFNTPGFFSPNFHTKVTAHGSGLIEIMTVNSTLRSY